MMEESGSRRSKNILTDHTDPQHGFQLFARRIFTVKFTHFTWPAYQQELRWYFLNHILEDQARYFIKSLSGFSSIAYINFKRTWIWCITLERKLDQVIKTTLESWSFNKWVLCILYFIDPKWESQRFLMFWYIWYTICSIFLRPFPFSFAAFSFCFSSFLPFLGSVSCFFRLFRASLLGS